MIRNMRLTKIGLLIITILTLLTSCKMEPEIPTETFDREVLTSLGTSGFYTIYESDIAYIGESRDGLIFVENRKSDVLALVIKNKETLNSITYTFKPYESRIANVYEEGRYTILLKVQNYSDKSYDTLDSVGIDINPNKDKLDLYVSYYSNPDDSLEKVDNILGTLGSTETEIVNNLYTYLEGFEYDNDLAEILSGEIHEIYRSSIEDTIDNQSGVCIDIANLGVTLLRRAGIPSRLVFGNYCGLYHAWIEYRLNEEWFMIDPVNKMSGLVGFSTAYVNDKYF